MNIESENKWEKLPATEQENYVSFHEHAYEEDLKHAEYNSIKFPRWSIISGYYAMHDITKLFLAKKFNIKITSPDIHAKTILAVEEIITDKKLKEKLVGLLQEAKTTYYNIERLKEKSLPLLLKKGKQERGKAQYYTQDYTDKKNINAQKTTYFIEEIVRPYIKLIRGLLK
jgi:hypothetical protein